MRNLGLSDLTIKEELLEKGFSILSNIFSDNEVSQLLNIISNADSSNLTFRKSKDLFAIRQFFREVPEVLTILAHSPLISIIEAGFGNEFFIVKSIYFDKPSASNWFVSYHQDLTISVDNKIEKSGFGPWTVKQGQFAVQPPLEILEDNFTIRIHLDDTTSANGALKVILGSHKRGVCRPEIIDWSNETEVDCEVPKGGIMIMKPLLLHSSGRTINERPRRVIHIEFSRKELPKPLNWSERDFLFTRIPE